MCFVDTSALNALLDEDDNSHAPASAWLWGPGRGESVVLLTRNYVLSSQRNSWIDASA